MNHYVGFDPYIIGERNEELFRGVQTLRLEERLRKDRGASDSRLVALVRTVTLPLLRGVGLAGR
jgi:hypothetical protein